MAKCKALNAGLIKSVVFQRLPHLKEYTIFKNVKYLKYLQFNLSHSLQSSSSSGNHCVFGDDLAPVVYIRRWPVRRSPIKCRTPQTCWCPLSSIFAMLLAYHLYSGMSGVWGGDPWSPSTTAMNLLAPNRGTSHPSCPFAHHARVEMCLNSDGNPYHPAPPLFTLAARVKLNTTV